MTSSRVSCSVAHRSVPRAPVASQRGRGSGNGRLKTSPKYLDSQIDRCLTRPSRLVPVEVSGRRRSYSPSPSSFQTITSRSSRSSWCRYSLAASPITAPACHASPRSGANSQWWCGCLDQLAAFSGEVGAFGAVVGGGDGGVVGVFGLGASAEFAQQVGAGGVPGVVAGERQSVSGAVGASVWTALIAARIW